MKFFKDLTQKKLAKPVMCVFLVSGGVFVDMGQADATAFITGVNKNLPLLVGTSGKPVIIEGFDKGGYDAFDIMSYGDYPYVCGVTSEVGIATGGIIEVNGGEFTDGYVEFCGGFSGGSANGNIVSISDGKFCEFIIGGGSAVFGNANGNTLNLLGGTFIDSGDRQQIVLGSKTFEGNAINNTVCIGGYIKDNNIFTKTEWVINAPKLTVYGGLLASDTTLRNDQESFGNTVKVFSVGNKINELDMESIQNLEFYIPKTAINGNTMLTVNELVNLENTNIKAGVEQGSKLMVGDKVTLLASDKGLENIDKATTGKLEANDFQNYDLTYEVVDNKKLNAKVTTVNIKENSKSPVETQAASLTMLNIGADMLAFAGFDNAASAIAGEVKVGGSVNSMIPFMAMGAAKTKVKSGSHVDIKGWNLNIGMAKEIENKAGKLLIGPVVEYGKGSYDSYLNNGFHGEGDTDYIGGGIMAKQTNDNGFYYEGSLRAGKLSNDYKANHNHYDSDTIYYSAHIGLGKLVKLSNKNSLDYYGKYFYTHQNGDDTTLYADGMPLVMHFDGVDSNRTRIGGRFTHDLTEKNFIYAGLAWQYEFSGTAHAIVDGIGTPAPSVKGSTGIMELGWKMNANKNLDLDLSTTGYVGKQKGASLNLEMNFKF